MGEGRQREEERMDEFGETCEMIVDMTDSKDVVLVSCMAVGILMVSPYHIFFHSHRPDLVAC